MYQEVQWRNIHAPCSHQFDPAIIVNGIRDKESFDFDIRKRFTTIMYNSDTKSHFDNNARHINRTLFFFKITEPLLGIPL